METKNKVKIGILILFILVVAAVLIDPAAAVVGIRCTFFPVKCGIATW